MDALTVDYSQRPIYHAMAGGLFHLYSGASGLFLSTVFWLYLSQPHGFSQWVDALPVLAIIALTVLYSRARARYVYPRLGYVAP